MVVTMDTTDANPVNMASNQRGTNKRQWNKKCRFDEVRHCQKKGQIACPRKHSKTTFNYKVKKINVSNTTATTVTL